jgi:hypothetical protein
MNIYGLIVTIVALMFSLLIWNNLPLWITSNSPLIMSLLIIWVGSFMLLFYYFGFRKD